VLTYPPYIRGIRAGRKRIVDKILEELKGIEDDDKLYIVVYDFPEGKNPKEFYVGLNALRERDPIHDIQRSTLEVRGRRTALAVMCLARHYGAEVRAFQVIEELIR